MYDFTPVTQATYWLNVTPRDFVPTENRAEWLSEYGVPPEKATVEITASLDVWASVDATINSDGTVVPSYLLREAITEIVCADVQKWGMLPERLTDLAVWNADLKVKEDEAKREATRLEAIARNAKDEAFRQELDRQERQRRDEKEARDNAEEMAICAYVRANCPDLVPALDADYGVIQEALNTMAAFALAQIIEATGLFAEELKAKPYAKTECSAPCPKLIHANDKIGDLAIDLSKTFGLGVHVSRIYGDGYFLVTINSAFGNRYLEVG